MKIQEKVRSTLDVTIMDIDTYFLAGLRECLRHTLATMSDPANNLRDHSTDVINDLKLLDVELQRATKYVEM